jgi:STE24 endopeptidase
MQVVVLAAFVVALTLYQEPSALFAPTRWTPAAAAAYVLLTGVLARLSLPAPLRDGRMEVVLSPREARRHNLLGFFVHGWMVAGLAGVISLGYGRWVGDTLGLSRVPLAGEAMALLPLPAAMIAYWIMEYPYHRAIRRCISQSLSAAGATPPRAWSMREYIEYNLRHQFLFVAVPVGLIILLSDSLSLYVAPRQGNSPAAQYVSLGMTVASAATVFVLAPMLIVRVWRTRKLPDSPLRRELEAVCVRMRLRYRDILVWQSGGIIANAGVMGLVPQVRYILLSDALLENMDAARIKAIFGHEAGHIRSHHVFYMALFAIGTLLGCGSAGDLLAKRLGWPEDTVGAGIGVVLLAMAWIFGFGWISRRFERQCDVIGACVAGEDFGGDGVRLTSEGAAVFARALEGVAFWNGTPVSQRNWRHGSIARRMSYLLFLGGTGGTRNEIDRLVRRIKLGLWILAAAGIALTAADIMIGG